MKKLELKAKRWFQTSYGSTYFTTVAILDGDEIARIDFQYGYGDHWLYMILEKVDSLDILPIKKQKHVAWQFLNALEGLGYTTFTSVADVNRKKDLVL